MVEKAKFKKGNLLEKTRFAPYSDYPVFIIDDRILIVDDEIIDDFDIAEHREIFEVIEIVE